MGNKHSHHSDPSISNSNIKSHQPIDLSLSNNSQQQLPPNHHLYHEVVHNEEADVYLPKHLLDSLKQQAKNGTLTARTSNNNGTSTTGNVNTTPNSTTTPNTVNTPRSTGAGKVGHRREPSYLSTGNGGGHETVPPMEIVLTMTNNNEKSLSATTPRTNSKNTPRNKTLGFSSSSSSKEELKLPTSANPGQSRSGSGGNVMQAVNRTKFRMERDLQNKSCFTLDEFKLFKGIFLSFCNLCFQQSHSHQTMQTPRGNTQEQWKNGQKRDSVSSTMSNSSSMASINGATPGKTILRQALLASSVSYYDIHQLYLAQGECHQLLFQHGKVVNKTRTKSNSLHSHYQATPSTSNVQATSQQTGVPFLQSSLDKKTSPPLLSTSPNNASYASPPQTTFIPATVPPLSLTNNSASMTLSNIEDMDLELVEKFVFDAVYRAVTDGHLANEHNHYHHHHQFILSADSFVLTFQRFILSLAAASISIRDGQVYAQKMSRLSMSTVFSDNDSDIEEHEQLKREALLRERSSLVFTMLDLDGDECLSREDLLTFLIAMDRLNLLTLKRTKGMLASARKMLFSPRSTNNISDLDTYSDGGMSPVNSEKTKGKKSVEEDDNNEALSSSLLTSAVAQSSEHVEIIKLDGLTTTEKFKLFETLVDQFFDFSYNQRKNSSLLNLKSASSLTLTRGEFFDNSQIFDDVFLNGLGVFETFFIPIMKPVHEFLSKSKDAYEISGKLKNMFSQQTYFCEIKGSMMFLYDADPSTMTGENSDIHSKCIETIDLRTCESNQ